MVNLSGPVDGPRYLQVEVQLMTRDPEALPALQTHAPAIRAKLLMLFSQVEPEQIADRPGKATPFAFEHSGMELPGKVRATLVAGTVAFEAAAG